MPIELRLLRCALALAEYRNFVRAAHAMHMSQPSLSRNIQEIERRVGTQLFDRGSDGVTPTDSGEVFLQHARSVVARSADLEREMDLVKGLEKGELSIGSATYPSVMMVERAIVRLVRAYPSVRLQIKNDNWANLLHLLRKREVDLMVAVLAGIEEEPELHITRLNQHQGYFALRRRHPLLASKDAPTLQSILRFPIVTVSRVSGPILRQFLAVEPEGRADQSSARSFPPITCESVAMMKVIVAETDAIGLFPLNAVTDGERPHQLVVLPLSLPFMKVDFGIVRLAHRSLTPLGERFVRLLLEADAELLSFEQKHAPRALVSQRRAK